MANSTEGVLSWSYTQGSDTLSGSSAVTTTGNGQGGRVVRLHLTSAQADVPVAIAFDKDLLNSFVVESETLNLTIESNSSSAPDDTVPVVLGAGFHWIKSDTIAPNPFENADVTVLYVTNLTAAAGDITIAYADDPTP